MKRDKRPDKLAVGTENFATFQDVSSGQTFTPTELLEAARERAGGLDIWYSTKATLFHIPLHIVQTMTPEDLQAEKNHCWGCPHYHR